MLPGRSVAPVRYARLVQLSRRRFSTLARQGAGRLLPPPISLPLRARFGRSRERELALLDAVVRRGDIVVDVGAHQGVYTHRLVRLVGGAGTVIAYEPQPGLADYLKSAARIGRMRHVQIRPRALSDEAGSATLRVPLRGSERVIGHGTLRADVDGPADTVQVPMCRLDDEELPRPVRFIKIDVEGYELPVVRGARRLIESDRPVLLIEVEYRHAGEQVEQLAHMLLEELGYTAAELAPSGNLITVPRETFAAGARLNERASGRRVNNFLFSPSGPTDVGR